MPASEVQQFVAPRFETLDWAVVIAYLLAILIFGGHIGRGIKTSRGFFIAEGRLGSLLVGLSLLGTYLSAMTMMALSGISFKDTYFKPDLDQEWNWLYTIQLPFLIVTAIVITRWILPRYREAGVISVYELLERRIHVACRILASSCFLLLTVGRLGMTIYLPSLALAKVTGFDMTATIVVMGLVVIIYTTLGGTEAVIWTDAVQVFVLVAGALFSLGYALLTSSGSAGGGFLQIAGEHGKFQMLDLDLSLRKPVTLWFILETLVQTIRIFGTQQDMTQRYMATSSTAKANRSVWIAILGYIPLAYLFYFMGTALFVYYVRTPDPNVFALAQEGKWDAVYPYFAVSRLPMGVAGLVIAAIFAAAQSTVSGSLNSAATVCVEDFYKRFGRRERSDRHYLAVARWLTVAWGILATAMAVLLRDIKEAQPVWNQIMAYSTNGVLALMVLALMRIRVRPWAAIAGFIVGGLCLFCVSYFKAVNFLLFAVIGNVVAFVVGLGLNALAGMFESDTPASDAAEGA